MGECTRGRMASIWVAKQVSMAVEPKQGIPTTESEPWRTGRRRWVLVLRWLTRNQNRRLARGWIDHRELDHRSGLSRVWTSGWISRGAGMDVSISMCTDINPFPSHPGETVVLNFGRVFIQCCVVPQRFAKSTGWSVDHVARPSWMNLLKPPTNPEALDFRKCSEFKLAIVVEAPTCLTRDCGSRGAPAQ